MRQIPFKTMDRCDAWLERCVVHEADWIICNSEGVRRDFISRFPHLEPRFVTVPNGFDPEDFANLSPKRSVGYDKMVLTHAGWFYGRRRPDPLFQALRLLRDSAELPRALVLQLVGSPLYDGESLQAIAARYGVDDMLILQGEVPHHEVMEFLGGSDIQLLVGFSGKGSDLQVPAKLFEYFGIGKPILALAPQGSAIAEMMERGQASGEVCDPDDACQIAAAIARIAHKQHQSEFHPQKQRRVDNSAFHRREQVGIIAQLLRSKER